MIDEPFLQAHTGLSGLATPPPELQVPSCKPNPFLTPQPMTKSFLNSECPSTTKSKKYPQTWKLYILPEFKQKSILKRHGGGLDAAKTARTARNSIMSYGEGGPYTHREPREGLKTHCRTNTQTSEKNQEDVGAIERIERLDIRVEGDEEGQRARTERVMVAVQRHRNWTGRIVLENQYSKEEADYLREKFTSCLIHKYKPNSETLY